MAHNIDTIIIGGGQAGLATSYHLKLLGCEHVVLEQAAQAGNAWRNDRWDSFALNTPNWTFRMPGAEYQGPNPGAFLLKQELVAAFEQYVQRFQLPVQYNARVSSVDKLPGAGGYRVLVGESALEAHNVVVATGLFQRSRRLPFSAQLSPRLTQLDSGKYPNPRALPEGAVLVVGSGQSGCQIAEELYLSGRKVYLCVGSAGRAPRRYRGRDIFEWMDLTGFLDRTPDMLPSPKARLSANPQVSGVDGGRSLNLHQFARDGVTLLGRLLGGQAESIQLAPDLHENLAKADAFEAEMTKTVDGYIARHALVAPPESLPVLTDGFTAEQVTGMDLRAAGITSIIWAMGYQFDFNLVKLPIFDSLGYPIQRRGVTEHPGLYFVGLPWLYKFKSGLLVGVGEDAQYVAGLIAAR